MSSAQRAVNGKRMNPRALAFLLASILVISGCSSSTGLEQPDTETAWSVDLPADLGAVTEAIGQGEHVLVKTEEAVTILAAEDGRLLWSMPDEEPDTDYYLFDTSVLALSLEGYAAWDASSGDELFRTEDVVYKSAVFDRGLISVECPGDECTMTLIDPVDGDQMWTRDTPPPGHFELISEASQGDESVHLPSTSARLAFWSNIDTRIDSEVVDVETGEIQAVLDRQEGRQATEGHFVSPDRFIELYGYDNGTGLVLFDTESRERVWTTQTSSVEIPPAGSPLIGIDGDGAKTILEQETGEPVYPLAEDVSYLHVGDDAVYLADHAADGQGSIRAEDVGDASTLWTTQIEEDGLGSPESTSSLVSDSHLLYRYRTDDDPKGKTVVIDRAGGTATWLSGDVVDPVFLGEGFVLTACQEANGCQPGSHHAIAYFHVP